MSLATASTWRSTSDVREGVVYLSLRERRPASTEADAAGTRSRVPTTIVLLGVTSLLTDVSSEMVTAILPLYLTFELRFTALQFGLYLGPRRGRAGPGAHRRRCRRRSPLPAQGLGAGRLRHSRPSPGSPCSFTGASWMPTTGVLLADRVGKGIRTAPRDAMISLARRPACSVVPSACTARSTPSGRCSGRSWRSRILAAIPEASDAVFLVSFSIALVGLAVLAAVRPTRAARLPSRPGASARSRPRRRPQRSSATDHAGRHRARHAHHRRRVRLPRATAASPTSASSSSRCCSPRCRCVYLVFAVPVGRLADRIGKRRCFVARLRRARPRLRRTAARDAGGARPARRRRRPRPLLRRHRRRAHGRGERVARSAHPGDRPRRRRDRHRVRADGRGSVVRCALDAVRTRTWRSCASRSPCRSRWRSPGS